MRDTFIKYYRMELINKTPLNSRKRTWKYYNDCDFLRPYVELYRLDVEESQSTPVTKQEKSTPTRKGKTDNATPVTSITSTGMIRCEYSNKITGAPETYKVLLQNDDEEDTEYQIFEANEAGELQEVRTGHSDGHMEEYEEYEADDTEYQEENEGRTRAENKTIEIVDLPVKKPPSDDPDEKFLMSCLPVLKRLSNKKNALLKLKIQTLLFEVEFGDDNDDNHKRRKAN